jgi:lipooligosaccharide transport system permease protein
LALRQYDYWATTYRRTWKGSAFGSFLQPLLQVAAMGVLLGGFIAADPTELEGATSYLTFVAPGIVAAHAFTLGAGEVLWPVMGMIRWNKTFDAMIATPLTPVDIVNAHLGFVVFRLALTTAVFMATLVPFGVFASVLGFLGAYVAAILLGMAFAAPLYAYTVSLPNELGLALAFRLGIMPMVLFSGVFFPIANLPSGLEAVAKSLPLWHGADLIRMFTLDRVDASSVFVHVVYLVALLVAGWWLAGRRLTARLVR